MLNKYSTTECYDQLPFFCFVSFCFVFVRFWKTVLTGGSVTMLLGESLSSVSATFPLLHFMFFPPPWRALVIVFVFLILLFGCLVVCFPEKVS